MPILVLLQPLHKALTVPLSFVWLSGLPHGKARYQRVTVPVMASYIATVYVTLPGPDH